MGGCVSKNKIPSGIVVRGSSDIRRIITSSLHISEIKIDDKMYDCYPCSEIKRFLTKGLVDKQRYQLYPYGNFDCNNYTLTFASCESKWYTNTNNPFGITRGDIYREDSDTKPRYNAVNFFITDDGELWLIDPQTDELFKPTTNSKFSFCCF